MIAAASARACGVLSATAVEASPRLLDAALWYARHELHVHALQPRGKVPATPHGCLDATTDPVAIEAMWSNPQFNIGIATGPRSGVLGLDIDGEKGEATLAELERKHGPLPVGAQVRTARGRHLYFRHPDQSIRNSAGKLGPGLDVRGEGGYLVAPPSIHPDGSRYIWAQGPGCDPACPPPLPAWLLDLLTIEPREVRAAPAPMLGADHADAYARAALERECADVAAAPEGTRNPRLNEAAFNLGQLVGGGVLREDDVRAALLAAASDCRLPNREAIKTVNSGIAGGMKHPRRAPEREPRNGYAATTPRALATPPEPEPWGEPIELPGLPSVPAWNDALLPDALRPWLSDVSERTQCPPEYGAVGAIVALGSVIGRACAIRPKRQDDWTTVPNLWGAVVGPPSAMKTPALREAMRPLHALAAEASTQYEAQGFDRESIEGQRKALKDALRKAASKGTDPSVLRDRHDEIEARSLAANAERRYVVNDPSVEKLGEILCASPRGVLLFRDELMGFLATLDKQGHESDRAFYLEAWNGDGSFVCDRIGRGTVRIEAACVSILGSIQPGPLGAYLRDAMAGGAGADGLMQRFQLLVYPDPPTSYRNVDRWPDSKARERATNLYRHLASLTPEGAGAEASDGLPFLRFAAEAQDFADDWRVELMTRLRAGDEHEAIEGHLAKFASLMPSLALIFHLADGGAGAVGLDSAQRAAAWCDLLEAHARRVYASATSAQHNGARALLAKIRAGRLRDGFCAKAVYDAGWTGLSDPAAVEAAIDTLVEHKFVRRVTVPTGGRPRVEVQAHPGIACARAAE